MKLFNFFQNDNKPQIHEKESFIELKIKIHEKALIKIVPWLIIILMGGGTYTFSNIISLFNTELDSVELPKQSLSRNELY